MPYQSIISDPTTVSNPTQGTRYHSIVPSLPNPHFVASRLDEQNQLKQQLQAPPPAAKPGFIQNIFAPNHNRLAGVENAVKNLPGNILKADKAIVKPVVDVAKGQAGQAVHDTSQLTSDVTGGTVNQFLKGVQRTPQMIAADVTNNPKAQASTQKKAFNTTNSGDITKKIVGSTVGTGSLLVGGGEAAGLKGAADATKTAIAKSSLKLGTAGAAGNTASTITQNPNATKKQLLESAAIGGVTGAALPVAAKGVGKLLGREKAPVTQPTQGAKPNVPEVPNIKEVQGPPVAKPKMVKPGQEGAVAPGQAVADVKQMLTKHQASTKFSGDLEKGAAQVEGSKKVIAEDTAKIIKQRAPLSNADKQTLQDYRDAKAAGLEAKPLPAHLAAEDQAVTELNKAAQAHDAEMARLNGQEAKAQSIEARDASTYTHRVAQDKGSSLDYVLQGDRKNPLSVGGLSKSTPSGKTRTMMAVTDEQGNRRVVAIKNSILKDEQGRKLAQGKLVQAIADGKSENLGKLKLNTNQDFLDKELKPYQTKVGNLQKEYNALSKVKTKGGVSQARFDGLAKKAALLEDARNFSGLSKSEAKSLRDATLKLQELSKVKEPSTNATGKLRTIQEHLLDMNNKISEIHDKYDPETMDKKVFVGKDGKKYTIGQATTSEITKATGQKYYVDPKLLALQNYAESRTALENARFIESIKQHPDFEKFASAPGQTAPKGWQSVDGLFQFMGYKFDPKIAEVLTDLVKQSPKGIGSKVSNFLRQTIVYFPLKHSLNELATSVVDRGLTSLVNPMAYKRGISSLVEAYHEVTNMGPKFQAAQKAGLHTVTGGDKALEGAFKKELLGLREDSPTIHDVAKQWGTSPKRLYNAVQELTVWQLQDILNMQRVIERTKPTLFSKGASLEDAVAKTQKYNLQYSVPSRVGPRILPGAARRGLSGALRSKTVFFGRYKYDIYKIATNIIKDTINPKSLIKNPKQNAQALDKLAAMALGAAVLWPIVDKGIQKATHNANAYMKAPGVLELLAAINDVRKGDRKPLTEASNQLYLSSAITQGIDLKSNRDSFSGKQIYDPNSSIKQQFIDIGKWVATQQAPSQQLKQAEGNKSQLAVDILMSLASARMPKNAPEVNNLNSLKFDSLPSVQSNAKTLVQKGDYQGAVNAIKAYDDQVLKASKTALKAAGQPVPDDATLRNDLEKAGYFYNPQTKTIQGWSRTVNTNTLDTILNPKTSVRGRSRSSSRTGSSSQKLFQ